MHPIDVPTPASRLEPFSLPGGWDRRRLRIAIAVLAALWLALPLLCLAVWGVSVLEKFLTALVLPAGLTFQLLLIATLASFVRRDRLVVLLAPMLLLFLLCSNSFVAASLMRTLESQHAPATAADLQPPLDAVVVLGGGLSVNRFEDVEVGGDGQRVILAAQLHHAGRTATIITTGSLIPGTTDHNIPGSEAAERLLASLGVPAEDVIQLAGENTSDEMHSLREWLDAHPEVQRYGLITSAFHMPRALRLARSQRLDPIPLPCCYRADPQLLTILDVMPNADALALFSRAMREYLATLVGR